MMLVVSSPIAPVLNSEVLLAASNLQQHTLFISTSVYYMRVPETYTVRHFVFLQTRQLRSGQVFIIWDIEIHNLTVSYTNLEKQKPIETNGSPSHSGLAKVRRHKLLVPHPLL